MKCIISLVVAMLIGFSAQAAEPVKKSKTGICHAPGTTYYVQTQNYTPYPTLAACLKSGGRLPKR